MPEISFQIEKLLKAEIDKEVEGSIAELDRRMERFLRPQSKRGLEPWLIKGRIRIVKPALTFAIVALLALGLGLYLGSDLDRNKSKLPQVLLPGYRQPETVAQGPEDPLALTLNVVDNLFISGTPEGTSVKIESKDSNMPQARVPLSSQDQGKVAAESRALAKTGEMAKESSKRFITIVRANGVTKQIPLPPEVNAYGIALRDDHLYMASADGLILRVTSQGESSIFISGLENPAGLAFDRKNNLFVAENTAEGRILKITPTGEKLVITERLAYPTSLAFDSAGNLYVAEQDKGRILRIRPIGEEITPESPIDVFAVGFSTATHFTAEDLLHKRGPLFLATSTKGELFVTDRINSTTVVYKISHGQPWWDKLLDRWRIKNKQEGE